MATDTADYFLVEEEFAQFRIKLVYNRIVDALGFKPKVWVP